jgi:hypothetical protein
LVLQPFTAAVLLAWQWDILVIPALSLVLLGFLIREPLTILARRKWAGHPPNAESRMAARWLAWEVIALLVCLAIAAQGLPWFPLGLLTALGFVLTAVSVWFAVTNRRRSIGLQVAAVAGLGSSAFLAALACEGGISSWSWLLWGVLTLHGIVSVLSVHARLEMRIATSRAGGGYPRRVAACAAVLQLLAAIPAALLLGFPVAIPLLFSSAVHAVELVRLASPSNVRERLQRVGLRMLAYSLAHMAIAVAALWSFAHP